MRSDFSNLNINNENINNNTKLRKKCQISENQDSQMANKIKSNRLMVKKFQKKDEISFKKSFNKDENISKNKNCKKFTNFRTSILPKKLKEEEIK